MKWSTDQIALIVNQDAGKVDKRLKILRKISDQKNLKLIMCDGADLDYTLRSALKNKNLKRLIIGGGDGSVRTAAGLVLRLRPSVEIAVLPVGTANYYAKSLGLTRSLAAAFDVAFGGHPEKRHLCRANSREFLIGVNVGATSRMFDVLTDEEKRSIGKLAYVRGVLRVMLRFQLPDIEIDVNGKKYSYASTELVVVNQDIQEFIQLVPKVPATEPYFEIVTYGLGRSRLSPLFAVFIFALTFGRNQKYLKRIKATKATVYSSNTQPVSIDGDCLETTPIEIELIKNPVTFVHK